MAVVDGVERDLKAFSARDAKISDSALAAAALALARELDNPENSATSKANCARELRDTMSALRALAPPIPEADGIDQLADRRQRRRRAKANA